MNKMQVEKYYKGMLELLDKLADLNDTVADVSELKFEQADIEDVLEDYSRYEIEDYIKYNFDIFDVFDEDDILEHVRNNCYIEDLVNLEWRY